MEPLMGVPKGFVGIVSIRIRNTRIRLIELGPGVLGTVDTLQLEQHISMRTVGLLAVYPAQELRSSLFKEINQKKYR